MESGARFCVGARQGATFNWLGRGRKCGPVTTCFPEPGALYGKPRANTGHRRALQIKWPGSGRAAIRKTPKDAAALQPINQIPKGRMMRRLVCAVFVLALFTGCASVKMESKEASDKAKQFAQPQPGKSGLYTYRDSLVGKALKKDIWVDGKCIGESAPDVFFYTEVPGGKHVISTESEFSPNDLSLLVEAGRNYFIRQYIKLGVFVGGAGLELMPEAEGKAAVAKLEMATPGACSKPRS